MSKIKNISVLIFGRSLNLIVALLFMPYLARALSIDDYGTYGQTLLIVDVIKTVLSGGLATILFVYLANSFNTQKKIISSNLLIALVIGLIITPFIYFSSSIFSDLFNNPVLKNYVSIYSFSIILAILNASLSSILIFYKKIKMFTTIMVTTNLLKLILLLISIQLFKSLELVFYSIIFIQCIQVVWSAWIIKKRISLIDSNLKYGFDQFKKGIPLSLTSILGFLILYSDGVMVSHLLNIKEYAIYRNGAIEVPLISTLYLSIAQIVLPKVAQLYSNGKLSEIINLKGKIVINSSAVIFPIAVFFILYSKEFIEVYVSTKYAASSIIFSIFTFTLLTRINDYLDVLIAAKKTKLILNVHIFSFLLNILLNYILINQLGIKGAALATVISLYIYALIFVIYTAKTLKTSFMSIFNLFKIGRILVISLLFIIPFYLFSKYFIPNQLFRLSISLLYFPLIYTYFVKRNFFDKVIEEKIKSKINLFTSKFKSFNT